MGGGRARLEQGQAPGRAPGTGQPRARSRVTSTAVRRVPGPACGAGVAGPEFAADAPTVRSMNTSSLTRCARESNTSRRSGSLVTWSSQNRAASEPSSRRASTTPAGRLSAEPGPR